MELLMNEYSLPAAVSFNYEELKAALIEKVKDYETLVYGDDQIKQAKSDRAELNKLDKALNDERIRLEKEYMVPFNTFKAQIDELRAIIKKAAATSDNQIKGYEERKKQKKREEIEAAFIEANLPEYITLEKVFNPQWMNSSVTILRIKECFKTIMYKDESDRKAIEALPEFSFEAMEFYKRTLDVAQAITEASKLAEIQRAKEAAARRRAEEEAAKAAAEAERKAAEEKEPEQLSFTTPESMEQYVETVKEEPKQWIRFQAYLTTAQALDLRDFFVSRNIEFKPV